MACPEYNTTFHPCTFPFVTLPPNASSTSCSSTYADVQREAYDTSRLLFFALGALVLVRYIYLLWYIFRRRCYRGTKCTCAGQHTVRFSVTDKGAMCGCLCMISWMVRTVDVRGYRGILPLWLSDQLIVFCQNVLVTALILLVRSWMAAISFMPMRILSDGCVYDL